MFSLDQFAQRDWQYIVWDDVNLDRIPAKKSFFGVQSDPFVLSDKYRGKQQIQVAQKPSIYVTNVRPDFGQDVDWFMANTVILNVNAPLFPINQV
jgi:hypothetical protein